ncbi:kinase domain protein [Necator americanus]|uniref:Kinase domain protein n=1 Tax=Necator americanus TaxID=51031 RepID=W2TB57_NECAM|nr:kinase domain protein [Necator americanus]ETN78809.1 kinase domain protein [Necator americanus]
MDVPSTSKAAQTAEISSSQNEDMQKMVQGLKDLMSSRRPPASRDILRIKMEYCGEKRCIEMDRPVSMKGLQDHLQKRYGKTINMYYQQGKGEVVVSIKNQDELDRAIKVPYSTNCSSCGASRVSFARSTGESSCSSGVQWDIDDRKLSAQSPRAPTHWKEAKCIGSGAFGSVYLAYDVDTGRDLAVKKIPIIPDNRELRREAQGLEFDVQELGRLQHPRIVQYLGVQKTSDRILIFMEYMTGGSLKDHIALVLEGLAFLHKNHIIHRDIKSANILRDSLGNVKIADFGSGKKMQSLASQQGAFHSTIHYTAPEVLLGKTAYGRKADVWSVGVTLVEMLTGKVPWKEFDPMAAMFQIAYEEPKIDLPATVEPVTADLCRVLMNKNFDERPMAAEVLLNHPAFKTVTKGSTT